MSVTQVPSLDSPYLDISEIIRQSGHILNENALKNSNWLLTNGTTARMIEKMQQSGIPLNKYVIQKIYWGVKTGFNKAFIINSEKRAELIKQDSKSAEIIKPLAIGDDIRKWRINFQDKWLIFTRRGININTYPAIRSYLQQWQTRLKPKPSNWQSSSKKWQGRKSGSYKWYEIQDNVAYYQEFDKHKIVNCLS